MARKKWINMRIERKSNASDGKMGIHGVSPHKGLLLDRVCCFVEVSTVIRSKIFKGFLLIFVWRGLCSPVIWGLPHANFKVNRAYWNVIPLVVGSGSIGQLNLRGVDPRAEVQKYTHDGWTQILGGKKIQDFGGKSWDMFFFVWIKDILLDLPHHPVSNSGKWRFRNRDSPF